MSVGPVFCIFSLNADQPFKWTVQRLKDQNVRIRPNERSIWSVIQTPVQMDYTIVAKGFTG